MKKFCLYEDCKIVLGYNRAMIYDFGRNEYYPIPISLAKIINKYNKKQSIDYVVNKYQKEYRKTIKEYFDFLFTKESIFQTETPELYLELSLEYDTYSIINTIILEYSVLIDLKKLESLINSLNVEEIELKISNISDLDIVLSKLNTSKLASIVLVIKYSKQLSKFFFLNLKHKYKKITQIIIYLAPFDKFYYLEEYKITKVSFIKTSLSFFDNLVRPSIFRVNINFFTEALKYNSYYHNKLFIDSSGYIIDSFTKRKRLKNLLEIKDYLRLDKINVLSFINKDNISICKDCEYRYMCVDPRIPKQNKEKKWYSENDCGYNPYIAKWKGQKGWLSTKQ